MAAARRQRGPATPLAPSAAVATDDALDGLMAAWNRNFTRASPCAVSPGLPPEPVPLHVPYRGQHQPNTQPRPRKSSGLSTMTGCANDIVPTAVNINPVHPHAYGASRQQPGSQRKFSSQRSERSGVSSAPTPVALFPNTPVMEHGYFCEQNSRYRKVCPPC